jgi:predicted small secreted protein
MKTTQKISISLLVFALLLSACQRNVTRNGDGSVDVETVVTQEELQDAISASIADPLIQNLTVSLQSGYILVSGTRQRLNETSKTDTLSFRIDLGVSNGQLTSTISNAQFDGFTVEQNRLDLWNTTIANRIARIGNKSPNSTLKSVTVTSSAVTMIWTAGK